jgi:GGDEF domain-containing protein
VINGEKYNLKCSIGYSICPEDADSVTQLLHLADQAMFLSKKG